MHISDLHFHRLPRKPAAYASKRLLGALNLVLRRTREFPPARARKLVDHLQAASWHHLLITGDLTQLGTPEEFALAREVLAPLLDRDPGRVTVIPGNHDRYVPEPEGKGAFEAHFGQFAPAPDQPLLTRRLTPSWWLAAWDSAVPAPWYGSSGRVRGETLRATGEWLASLPAGARVIVANHYPVFAPSGHSHTLGHGLNNQMEVEDWLKASPVDLYLHGHIHRPWVVSVPGAKGQLTLVNSASSTGRPRGRDATAYHRIVLDGEQFRVEPCSLD